MTMSVSPEPRTAEVNRPSAKASIREIRIRFAPLDSLMFRDGRPFNQSDEGASLAQSIFPPYPPTLVGASRAALWRKLGGTLNDWNADVLGDGTDWQSEIPDETDMTTPGHSNLGPLSFGPPVLLIKNEPVFPVPLHIVRGKDKHGHEQFSRLEPGVALECDLGPQIRLPTVLGALEGVKPVSDQFIRLDGLQKVLARQAPAQDDFVDLSDLWATESRVGIGLQADTRAVAKSQLYMASHIRMQPGISIGMTMCGWEQALPEPDLQPLAGEHRMADVTFDDYPIPLPDQPPISPGAGYCIVLISPMVPSKQLPRPGEKFAGMPGSVVSACIGKPLSIGGWDSIRRKSIPLRQAAPAGSVWFMQLEENETPDWSRCPKGLGIAGNWGFGHYLIGKW